MRKPQKIILAIIIILIIVLVMILGVYTKIMLENKKINEYTPIEEIDTVETLEPVKVRNSFYAVKRCVDKFYSYYISVFDIAEDYYDTDDQEVIKEIEQGNASVLYNMLDKEYIQAEEVTEDNIKTKLSEIKDSIINITDMYVSQKDNNIEIYVVKGVLKEKTTENIDDFQIMVKIDVSNTTFSIIPQEYAEKKYNNLEIGKEINVTVPVSIEKNDNNTFKYNNVSDEAYVKDLFIKFKSEIQNFTKIAYDNLDEEYRNKRFETFEKFEEYINNKEEYSTIQIEKYQKTVKDDYTQYVCVDQNENYYIFRENAIMDYSLILDTYTIDTDEFLEKYNNGDNQTKVGMNIEKIKKAINNVDYKYVYEHLDETYRNNNFPNINVFENYIKTKFFDKNNIEYIKITERSNDTYIYEVKIIDEQNEELSNKIKFIIKLEEGTEFKMSIGLD